MRSSRVLTLAQPLIVFLVLAFTAPLARADVYFPQIAAGGGYSTVITLMHTDARTATSATGRLRFFNPNGSARTVTSEELGQGSEFTLSIPSQGTRVITILSVGNTTSVGTAIYEVAGLSIGGVARFTFGGSSVGVLNAAPIRIAYIPLVTRTGFNNGVALQNPAGTAVNVRLRLIKPDGTIDQVSNPPELNPFPAFGQFSRFVNEMGFANPVQSNSVLEVAVQSAGNVAVLPLVLGNGYTSSSSLIVPAELEMPLFFAQVVDGSGFTTSIRLFNPFTLTARGFLKFYTTSGNPRPLPVAGVGVTSAVPVTIPPGRTVVYETTGESEGVSVGLARVEISVPVGGLATLFYGQTHAGLPNSLPMRSGRIPVDTSGGNTGVALATYGPNNVNIRLTLKDRDNIATQTVTPIELTPLLANGQYARYVTEMGFTNAADLKDNSLLVESLGVGNFLAFALLDRGAFSATATSRQRVYDPDQLAGTYRGDWNIPDFSALGNFNVSLAVDANSNATLTLSVQGSSIFGGEAPPATATGVFNSNGELIINGPVNVRIRADGAFTIFVITDGTSIVTESGFAAWYAFTGEISGGRLSGSITLGQTNGTVVSGSFNATR